MTLTDNLSRITLRLGFWKATGLIVLLSVLFAHLVILVLFTMVVGEMDYTTRTAIITTLMTVAVSTPFVYWMLRLFFALEAARKKLEALSQTDELTGIHNRRHFYEIGEMEVARAHRYRQPLSLLLLDLDRFKLVNDQFGHIAGDIVLAEIASLCRDSLRNVDIMGRLGGEEFAILLPMTGAESAVRVAEKLVPIIANHRVRTQYGELRVTISIGIATLGDTDSLLTLIKEADRNLYRAKESGRNQAVASEAE